MRNEVALRKADEATAAASTPALIPGAGTLVILLAGFALGLFSTEIVLDRGWDPGGVTVGSWIAHPRIGTPSINPYALAGQARSGEVPLAASEGLAFRAEIDATGFRLLRTCSYGLTGLTPTARFWTLTAVDDVGRRMANPAERSGFTSSSVIRDMAGAFTIELGPEARPGNWLPTSGQGPMALVLRVYDTPLTTNPDAVGASSLPTITRHACGTPGSSAAPTQGTKP